VGRSRAKRRHPEKYRRANPYHIDFDNSFASPLQVIRGESLELAEIDDDDVLELYHDWLYPQIPLDQFRIWGREPFGQEKIDAAARPRSKAEEEQALDAAIDKEVEKIKAELQR
jgi:hypothetical protein